MAFSVSLINNGKAVSQSVNFSGGELKRPTFFKDDEVFIKALITEVYKESDLPEDALFSNKSVVKNHIDNGAEILWNLFEENGRDINKWYQELIRTIELEGGKDRLTKDLDIFIGRNILNNDDLIMEMNNTQKHANSHLAIMGKPGVGKTQFLLKILSDIRIQSNFQTNFIFFDYKGDVIDNDSFIEVTRSRTYQLLQNNESLPINPFVLPAYDDQAIQVRKSNNLHVCFQFHGYVFRYLVHCTVLHRENLHG